MHAAHRQKLADVAHKPSRAANRHQRRAHVPESQIAPEAQTVLDRLLSRTMPVGHQIRRDQRPRARPDDHPHLILQLGQQHRQRPGRVRATRPAATQHQTHVAAAPFCPPHGLTPRDRPGNHATRPCLSAAIDPPVAVHRTLARPRCRNQPLRLGPSKSDLTSKRAAAESRTANSNSIEPRTVAGTRTNDDPLRPRLAAAFERSEVRPRGNSTALKATRLPRTQRCDHRMTAHSLRSGVATPDGNQ